MSYPLDTLEAAAVAMLDDNRVASALSKVGRNDGSLQRHRELTAELASDLRHELEADHGALLLALDHEDRELLWTVVEDACDDHLRRGPLEPDRYFVDLAHAFIRGRLDLDASPAELVVRARQAKLSLHKFKRKDGPPRVMDVLSRLAGIIPTSLLDVGSGRGAFLWPLLDRFDELPVTAIDRLEHRVADIEAVRRGGVGRLQGTRADVTALPFDDRAFDVVTILEVLEHLERPEAAAREVMRVADRFVVASVPSHEDDNPEHIQLFTRDSLTDLLVAAGATHVEIGYVRGHMIAIARAPSADDAQ